MTAASARSPVLHERTAEVAAVERVLGRAAAGAGATLAIDGPAGLGKTSLLSHARERAAQRGMRVLAGRAEDLEGALAFGVAIQLFGDAIRRAVTDDPAVLSGAAALGRRVLEAPADQDGELLATLHGLYWLTVNLTDRAPLALVVDDLHWCDTPSLRFLLYLLARIEELPVAVLVATRAGEPLSDARRRLLSRLRAAVDIELLPAPLSARAVAATVRESRADADDRFCAAAHAATAGNPLLVRELLASTRSGDAMPLDADALAAAAAPRVERTLGPRLDRLGADAGRLATAIAVLEPDASLHRAARLAALGADDARGAAGALERADVLSGPEPLAFSHPLLRAVVLARLSGTERQALELHAARLLDDDGVAPEKVAAHLLAGEPCAEDWAVAALRRAAAGAIARGSPEAAATYLRRAAEAPAAREVRAEVLVALGAAETSAGEPQAAARFDEALAVVDDPRRRAEVLEALAEARYVRSDYAGAVDAFARGLHEAADLDEVLEARLIAGVGTAAALAPERGGLAAELLGARLAELVARPPDAPTLPERVLLALAAGRGAASMTIGSDEAIALARSALGTAALPPLGRIVAEPALAALVIADELDDAERRFTALIDDARERGALATFVNVIPMRALCHLRLGAVAAAQTDAEDAIRLAREVPEENLALPTGHAIAALARLERGDLPGARDAVDVQGAERRWGHLPVYGVFLAARARVSLEDDEPEAALSMLREGGARMVAAGFVNSSHSDWRTDAALAALRTGDDVAAHGLAEEELGLATRFGAPRAIGMAQRALGLITGGGDGLALLRAACATLAGSPARLDHARVRIDLGAALRRAGERTEARMHLEAGTELAHRCSAAAAVGRGTGELRTLGLRPRRAATSGHDALTPSELRTATMAAAGMTNRAIAQQLFLTLRTIESHLTGAYRKLGITSRGALPEALADRSAEGPERL